jgi:hypothetical protein
MIQKSYNSVRKKAIVKNSEFSASLSGPNRRFVKRRRPDQAAAFETREDLMKSKIIAA